LISVGFTAKTTISRLASIAHALRVLIIFPLGKRISTSPTLTKV